MINKKIKIITLILGCTLLSAACSVNLDKAEQALKNFGQDVSDAFSSEEVETEPAPVQTEETTAETTEVSEESAAPTEIEATPVPTATPTPSPVPTATPAPERVDLSELTEDQISDEITVEEETFAERYVFEGEVTGADFSGVRLLISNEQAPNVQTAINAVLNGFYEEAAGVYSRCINDAIAEVSIEYGTPVEGNNDADVTQIAETGETTEATETTDITETTETAETTETTEITVSDVNITGFDPYHVIVGYEYSTNGRVLSVIMTCQVLRGDEIIDEDTEYLSMDLYTGQYINMSVLSDDPDALEEALIEKISETAGEDFDPESVESLFIMVEEAGSASNYARIIAVTEDGAKNAVVDLGEYSDYFNRYGRIVTGIAG